MRRQFFVSLLAIFISLSSIAKEKPFRILSINGGGVRGVIPATIIDHIETDLGKPVFEIFDMVAGTSIGGILALTLAAPTISGKPRTAEEALDIAYLQSDQIFRSSYSHWLRTLAGLVGPKYESDGLLSLTEELFGELKLSETLIPVLITGYHVDGESGVEFFSIEAKKFPADKDCLMREVAMATAAAPTYFDLVDVHFSWGEISSVADGALYKNDPSLAAYATAHNLYPTRKIEIYSLGTGSAAAEGLTSKVKGRGMAHWASPIIRHLLIGGFDADHTALHKLLNYGEEENYFRLDVHVDGEHKELDNVSPENLSYLLDKGVEATHSSTYKRMIEKLRKN